MAIFGRKKNEIDEPIDEAPVKPEGEPGVDRDWQREFDGPYDIGEVTDLDGRVDLGALRLPAVPGMEMRLDIEKGSNKIIGVTATIQGSKLQLQAFAAPRSEGLWDEIREGLVEGIKSAGGSSQIDPDGIMGQELLGRMPGQDSAGRVAFAPNRFIGIDGPRWFLRGVINGPAATETQALGVVRAFLRQVVVDRGSEPRPPREVLTLTAPKGVIEEAARRRAAARAAATGVTSELTEPGGTQAGGGAEPAKS